MLQIEPTCTDYGNTYMNSRLISFQYLGHHFQLIKQRGGWGVNYFRKLKEVRNILLLNAEVTIRLCVQITISCWKNEMQRLIKRLGDSLQWNRVIDSEFIFSLSQGFTDRLPQEDQAYDTYLKKWFSSPKSLRPDRHT